MTVSSTMFELLEGSDDARRNDRGECEEFALLNVWLMMPNKLLYNLYDKYCIYIYIYMFIQGTA